jgi:hypothetical protein
MKQHSLEATQPIGGCALSEWKTLTAEKAHESRLIAQYVFKESCAKAFIFESSDRVLLLDVIFGKTRKEQGDESPPRTAAAADHARHPYVP